jgi:Ca2+/Na+ antiporter
MGLDWLQLAICALSIAYAGAKLTRLADAIGEKTGMSGSWVGLLLLAAVTSLPELATGISAVTVADAPNIALGDVLGSTVFNLALLVGARRAAPPGHHLSPRQHGPHLVRGVRRHHVESGRCQRAPGA